MVDWTESVRSMQDLLRQGEEIRRMMQVTGEEGISLQDFVLYQKSLLIDMIYLQQDAYDEVDASTDRDRQKEIFMLLKRLTDYHYHFADKEDARIFFVRLTSLLRNLNYASFASQDYQRLQQEVDALAGTYT